MYVLVVQLLHYLLLLNGSEVVKRICKKCLDDVCGPEEGSNPGKLDPLTTDWGDAW